MNDTSKVVLALLAGFVAGAAAGILLAPEKGTDLRQKISETVGEWSDSIAEAANSGMKSVTEIKEKVEEKSNTGSDTKKDNNSNKNTTSQKRHV